MVAWSCTCNLRYILHVHIHTTTFMTVSQVNKMGFEFNLLVNIINCKVWIWLVDLQVKWHTFLLFNYHNPIGITIFYKNTVPHKAGNFFFLHGFKINIVLFLQYTVASWHITALLWYSTGSGRSCSWQYIQTGSGWQYTDSLWQLDGTTLWPIRKCQW